MKKVKNLLVPIIFLFIGMSACNQENEDLTSVEKKVLETGEYTFIFEGVTYTSAYEAYEDTVIYMDKSLDDVLIKIASAKNLLTIVDSLGIPEYIIESDMPLVLLKHQEEQKEKELSTRGIMFGPHLYLYEDTKFKGKVLYDCEPNLLWYNLEFPEKHKLYKKISSLKLEIPYEMYKTVSVVLSNRAFWSPPDSGSRISFSITKPTSYLEVKSLKDYKLTPTSSSNWNDRVTEYLYCAEYK